MYISFTNPKHVILVFCFSSNNWIFFIFFSLQASGSYWYALAIQRVMFCLMKQCDASKKCNTLFLSCSSKANARFPICLDDDGPIAYGIYEVALPVISLNSIATRILYSNVWGLTSLRQENLFIYG